MCPIPGRVTRAGLRSGPPDAEDRPMRTRTATTAALVLALVASVAGTAAGGTRHLPGTACPVFPADNYWHADVSGLPVHPRSAAVALAHVADRDGCTPTSARRTASSRSPTASRSPSSTARHPKVPVAFDYADESDRVGYPLGSRHPDRGRPRRPTATGTRSWSTRAPAGSTRRSSTYQRGSGWTAGSGAIWSLTSNKLRPQGWTSADAAGLPILPGLLRYDEVSAGRVDHAIRFTTDVTDRRHVWPARHDAGIGQRPVVPADGCAVPAQGRLPDLGVPRRHPGRAARR